MDYSHQCAERRIAILYMLVYTMRNKIYQDNYKQLLAHETKWLNMKPDKRCEQTSHWWENTETVNKHIKCPTWWAIRKRQIGNSGKCHCRLIKKGYNLKIMQTDSFTSEWSNFRGSSHAENSGSEHMAVLPWDLASALKVSIPRT